MVTTSVAHPIRRTRRTVLRVLFAIILLLVLVFAAVVAWFYYAAHSALPQVDGRLSLPGLSSAVTVARDARGVPHITAATLDDLFLAQGFVTAQDRFWQMDMSRRFAAGEMSEVLGKAWLNHDRRQRTLLIRATADARVAELSPDSRARLDAYARGVNAYIATQDHLPIEFRVLGYRPKPWTVTDSFLVAANMVQMLNLDVLGHQMTREKLTAMLTPELAADLYPNSSWRDHPPVSGPGDEFAPADTGNQQEEQQPEQPPVVKPRRRARVQTAVPDVGAGRGRRGRAQVPRRRRRLRAEVLHDPQVAEAGKATLFNFDSAALTPGSNNWVVSGAHTVSGKPLLANDMHLAHQLPNVWYEAHLTSGTYDVAGVTLPGLPFVIVGHNQRIAWGFTNIGPAVADLYVENFNERGEYQAPDGWHQPERHREVIHVRGGRDEVVDVVVTRHGPIVSGISMPSLIFGGSSRLDDKRQIALKWTLYQSGGLQNAFFAMNTAQNWDEFRQALRQFASPAQNVVYADVDGHIGYSATGMVPIRAAGDGSVPVSGADGTHEWTGFVPFEQLPNVLDPPSGIIGTANGRITPDGYQYVISNEWGPPYRTERIYRVLGADKKFSPADMLTLQTDIYSDFDRFCAQRMVYALDHAPNLSPRARQAAEMMRNWDGRETTDSAAAMIVAMSRRELARITLSNKVGDSWREYRWYMSSVWLENLILRQPASWLPPNYATWDDLLAASLEKAVNAKDAPRNLNDWRWGKDAPIRIQHPIFGGIPWLRRWAGTGEHEQSGNGYTVKQVGSTFGPSERMTVDFSDFDNSTLNIVNGESGQIFSRHFMDQWRAWYDGTTFPLPFSPAAVEKAKTHQLVLQP